MFKVVNLVEFDCDLCADGESEMREYYVSRHGVVVLEYVNQPDKDLAVDSTRSIVITHVHGNTKVYYMTVSAQVRLAAHNINLTIAI